MTAIELTGLTKTYPGPPSVTALTGVDLRIDAGQITAILGPSGCGKTTLLRAVAGVERLDGGTIVVGDRVLDGPGVHLTPERRRVGIVPQEGALFPHLDVASNVAFGLRSLGRPERAARVGELLELVGLPGYEDRLPHELSGGQQQRVALARALAPTPDVVLLDEPFSALDTALRSELRDKVAAVLRATSTTAVLVTHDQDEALTMADRVAVMRAGSISQAGTPQQVYREPVDLWAGRFLGDAVVLDGNLDRSTPGRVRTPLGLLALAQPPTEPADGPVQVLVRPEQIERRPQGPEAHDAEVRHLRFQGASATATLRVGPAEVTARWTSTDLPDVGDRVAVEVIGSVMAYPTVSGHAAV